MFSDEQNVQMNKSEGGIGWKVTGQSKAVLDKLHLNYQLYNPVEIQVEQPHEEKNS